MTRPNNGHHDPSRGPAYQFPLMESRKNAKWVWVTLGVVGAALAACLIGCAALIGSSTDGGATGDKTITTTSMPVAGPASKATSKPVPLPPKAPAQPKPADFKLTVKILEKQCFGSAGCNVQYRISKVAYTGPALNPDGSYEISYKVTGLEDPKIGTFTLNGDGSYSVDEMEIGQTANSGKVVKAAVTEVEAL